MKAPAGISLVNKSGGIAEYRLDKNGLRILLVPLPTAGVAGFMVTYHVGSRNEAIGYTGATHLLEHLMFKGSKKFNKENKKTIWNLLETKGALVNATTWTDRTNYYEVVPKRHLATAIAIEADRMRHARIREADRMSEMTVVRNEYERGENQPMEALDKQLWASAYLAHPYHHSTIGWKNDIERVPIERLQQFYNDFYWPDNATATVVGDFDPAEALRLIVRAFGRHTKAPHRSPEMYTEEPKQEGQRRVLVRRTGDTHMVGIAHKIPAATHADMAALVVLSTILADGKSSRLYKALVDTALAIAVQNHCYQFRDPGLFITYVTFVPPGSHEGTQNVVMGEYKKIIQKGVTAAELTRAKQTIRAAIAARRDGPYALLSALNEEIATGDWTRFHTFPQAIEKVRAADIKRVAKTYLTDDQSTVGWFEGQPS